MNPTRQPGYQGENACVFCAVLRGDRSAHVVLEDEHALAFLDHRPLFPGHVLLIPRLHVETLPDLPRALLAPFFRDAQLLTEALQQGLGAEGVFAAMNNRVSQSVPHLHLHLVPRRKGDGLRGFFWPRHPYPDDEAAREIASRLTEEVTRLRPVYLVDDAGTFSL